MKQILFSILTIAFLSTPTFSQTYWQQEVNYTISVKLDDVNHVIRAQESFEYINNSPQTLDFIYIHLWANAYKNGETALGKQTYASGNQILKFDAEKEGGYIDSLDFTVNGTKVSLEYDAENPDIAKITLPNPLPSGGRVTVATPFKVKLPSGSISRMGHVGQSYQITQWYPKPAVYDKNGWNPMPYLNQGEFYSEYGSYDVTITLPKNYVVGATGDLQTQSELDFLNELAAQTEKIKGTFVRDTKAKDAFPASSTEWKTIRYKQSKVHDFAWFADKRFCVLKGEVEMPASKRKVTSWAMFTPKNGHVWKNAIEYINDGTYFYSKWNGDYPYNQVTAVDGTISAGGGMEYPNVTVIGNANQPLDLEIVIVHEVGHNWFYGILGSNERVHGWMDEGMNTLNELRYVYSKYPDNTSLSDLVLGGRFHFNDLDHYDMADFTFRLMAGLGDDQPIETNSADFSSINYGAVMYSKTGLVFNYLKSYLGDELFDKCMHTYFETWKFKHPQPEDMKTVLEKESGKDLGWLFDDLIQTTNHIDYKLSKVKTAESGTSVKVKNVGQVNGPIEVNGYQDGKLIATAWVESATKKAEINFENVVLDEVRINGSGRIPELNKVNNNWHKKGLFGKIEKSHLEFGIGDNEPAISNTFWTPFVGANVYDKFMLGVAIHNNAIPFNKFQYTLIPMYSFGGKRVSGMADFSYTFLPRKTLKLSRFGIAIRSFKQDTTRVENDGYYVTASPFWFAKLGNRKKDTPVSQTLLLQSMYRLNVNGPSQTELIGGFIKYDLDYTKTDFRYHLGFRTDYLANAVNGDQMGRSSIEMTVKLRYLRNKKERWAELRGYAGSNWLYDFYKTAPNSSAYSLALSGTNGAQDIFTESYFFGRNETQGFWSQQRLENQGGFRSTSNYGTTSYWLASGNFFIQSPVGPKIFGFFADGGIFPDLNNSKVLTAFNAGVGIRLANVFGLYFPLLFSKDYDQSYGNYNYANRIRLTLNFSLTNRPLNLKGLL